MYQFETVVKSPGANELNHSFFMCRSSKAVIEQQGRPDMSTPN